MPDNGNSTTPENQEPAAAPAGEPTSSGSNVTTQPAQPSVSAGAQDPPQTGENWELRFKGLKQSYDRLVGEKAALEAKVTELSGQLEAAKSELSVEKEKATKASNTLTETEQARNALAAQLDRLKRINKVNPNLFAYAMPTQDEAGNNIPPLLREDLTGDEYEAYLQRMSATIGDLTKTAVRQHVAGAAPPSPAPAEPQKLTQQELVKRMFELSPGDPGYDELYNLLLEEPAQ